MNFLKVLVTGAIILAGQKTIAQQLQPVDYVNPFIGTGQADHLTVWESKGATFPGVLAPFGMVQIAPDGYTYADKKINCFSFLNHTSGWGSGGNFHVMAAIGKQDKSSRKFPSAFRHATEKTTPYYYSVMLDDDHIKAEFTATARVGYGRFTFPSSDAAEILLADIRNVRLIGHDTVTGMSAGCYFMATFNKPFKSCRNGKDGKLVTPSPFADSSVASLIIDYSTSGNQPIDVRIGFSTTSFLAAAKNLAIEAPDWNFEALTKTNRNLWNDELKKIEIKGGSKDEKIIFYTALYHSLFMPVVLSDAGAAVDKYTALYPWDTYRSKHPLFNIIEPKRQGDMITSVLDEFDKSGWLPADNMMGNHNIELILDSYVKGVRNFDAGKALTAMRKSVLEPPYARREMADFVRYGYVPAAIASSVTHSLEFAYNDWALAEYIRVTGNKNTYKNDVDTLLLRSGAYANLYDANTGFIRAKSANGEWMEGGYCEGTEWTWSWYVPHDVNGLVNLMGGRNKFSDRLTECFDSGHYMHDNEPPLHYAYLFNYSGEPWKTQKYSRKIMEEYYYNTPGGIPGNDDLGALSSWYVLSAMGFYPVTPGKPLYEIGSPLFDEITIHLDGGKKFVIRANNNSKKNVYIQSARMAAGTLNRTWISHEDIVTGKTLVLNMGPLPNKKWAVDKNSTPPSMTTGSPAFSFSNFKLSAATVNPDEAFDLAVAVTNNGDATGTAELSVIVDKKIIKKAYEVIKAGETKRLTYPTKLYLPGLHTIGFSKFKSLQIRVADHPAEFIYSNLSVPQPALLMVNEACMVTAVVKNIGGAAGIAVAEFYVDAKKMQHRQLTLQPGEEQTIQFSFAGTADGCYEVAIGNLAALKVRVITKDQKSMGENLLPAYLKAAVVLNFDDGPAGMVKDISGRGNNASVVGKVKWVNGLFGKAIQTDASQLAYLEIPGNAHLDSISDEKTITMMCWVYPMEEVNFADIFSKGDWNTIQLKGGNSVINYYTQGWEGHESSAYIPTNWNRHWHHIAGVTEDGYLKLYVDGNLAATKKAEPRNPKGETGVGKYSGAPWNIGRNASSPERLFKGYIDDVMLFERALTQQEIFDVMMHIKK